MILYTEKQLEDALKAISEEETRTARLYTIGKITDEVWDSLWQEWQDKRRSNQISLVSLYRQHKARIEDLDPARFGTIVNMVLLPPFAYLKHISDQVKAKEMQAVVGRNKKSSRLATASQCSEYVSVCSP